MGYMCHHTIVVTTYDEERIETAFEKAIEIWESTVQITPVLTSPINGYMTFFISTDGSKEGWTDSLDGDDRRKTFLDWLDEQRFDDLSSPFSWAEIQYGDDEHDNLILRHDGEVESKYDDEE